MGVNLLIYIVLYVIHMMLKTFCGYVYIFIMFNNLVLQHDKGIYLQ